MLYCFTKCDPTDVNYKPGKKGEDLMCFKYKKDF